MVNYYANSTEVLGDNYSIISLECDEYNPSIDGTVTLTVTAKSVYGNPIEDMEIPVTASEGNFTELNGSSITGASTVTGTTDSNGEFTLTYSCTEWGLITFTANNKTTQANVTGWKQVQTLASDRVKVFSDGKNAKIRISGTFITSTSAGEYNLGTINTAYQPDAYYVTNYTTKTSNYFPVYLGSDDTVIHLNKGSTSNANIACYCTLFYPLKTPLY